MIGDRDLRWIFRGSDTERERERERVEEMIKSR